MRLRAQDQPFQACHFCGVLRAADKLSAATRTESRGLYQVRDERSYCADDKRCLAAACRWELTGEIPRRSAIESALGRRKPARWRKLLGLQLKGVRHGDRQEVR